MYDLVVKLKYNLIPLCWVWSLKYSGKRKCYPPVKKIRN